MKPDPAAEGRRWFAQAERDLASAIDLSDHCHYNVACFQCQQVIDKALKAFLYYRGAREVRGHSAAELCQDAASLDPSFAELRPIVVPADKYYISTRYPDGFAYGSLPYEAYDAEDAAKAIRMARQALEFIRVRLR
ncbi:MAG: HEPN domain-containing protein [Firmicutes bacterium]|nr:HEPN domain-containing protein [Candidatus Fermentithermobacillaceae bacterium]